MTAVRSSVLLALSVLVGGLLALVAGSTPASTAATDLSKPPPVRHVFVINLENKGYDETFGPDSPAPYLSRTLRGKGQLLTQYYGTAHNSLPQLPRAGQRPGAQPADPGRLPGLLRLRADRHRRAAAGGRQRLRLPEERPHGRRPAARPRADLARLHGGHGHRLPAPGGQRRDGTQQAEVGDQYAARHNPFVYFTSLTSTDRAARPRRRAWAADERPGARSRRRRNLSYITPNLCNDAHDSPCVDGRPGGLATADAWLKTWVPKILASPAYQAGRPAGGHLRRGRHRAAPTAPTPAAARDRGRTRRCRASSGRAADAPARCWSRRS